MNYGFNYKYLKNHLFHLVFCILIAVLLLLSTLELCSDFYSFKNNNKNISFSGNIIKCTIRKSFTMEYMFMYILPLFAFGFIKKVDLVLFVIYFIFISFVIIKNKYFVGNVMCELFGYTYYDCIISNNQTKIEKILISKVKLGMGYEVIIHNINNDISLVLDAIE
jgi:fatty-acid desaturase